MTTVCDAYDSLPPDDDEYEDTYVMVELSGIGDTEYFSRTESPRCRIWGLDSQQPILQIDRYFFVGGYEDVVGTALFFDEADEREEESDKDGPSEAKASNEEIFTTFTEEAYKKSTDIFNRATSHLDHVRSAAANAKKLKLYGHTFKKLSMHRAFLNKKQTEEMNVGDTAEETDGLDVADEVEEKDEDDDDDDDDYEDYEEEDVDA